MDAEATWLEAAWLRESEANALLGFVTDRASDRKLRLFACACGRMVAPFVTGIDTVELLEVAERVADNRQTDSSEWHDASDRAAEYSYQSSMADPFAGAIWSVVRPAGVTAAVVALGYWADANTHPNQVRVALVREIFGNPFRPVDFAPWRTDTAVSLARQMYEARDFGAMPILADALQDAGCDNDEVLAHCRGSGPHVRGCWVVDGVLGLS